MSMASYNLLKAAADGLADAINYRTNLKRKRREEEYNYNRDWQRNENEYQRDLGREREKLDYITDYNWKQQQRAHDRDIEWANQKREADKARLTDFFDTYNPANVNPYDRADVYNYNTKAIANGVDYLLKPEQSSEEALKEKEALLNLQLKFDRERAKDSLAKQKALIDYQNANRPKEKNPYEQLLNAANKISNETGMPIDQAIALVKNGKLADMPSSVKGGSGNGAVMREYNWEEDKDLYKYIQDINTTRKAISDQIMRSKIPETAKQLLDKIIGIQFETEDEKKKVIEQYEELTRGIEKNEKQALDYHFNNLLATENYLNNLLRKKTNGKYQWDRNLNDFYNVEERKAKADLNGKAILENMKKGNSDLLGKSTRPINIPPVIQPQNNPPVSVNTDEQKYLRGEMSALEFQQLHPNYPLPQRYY